MIFAAGTLPTLSRFSPLSDSYATKGTAALGLADTGQAWTMLANPASAALSIIGGKLTNASAAGSAAGHALTGLGQNVTRIGGRFTLSSNTAPGSGAAAFVIWRWAFHTVALVPDSGFHLVVTETGWGLGYWLSGSFGGIAAGTFSPVLATNGTTLLKVDAYISGSEATLHFPDGSIVAVVDSKISTLAGQYADFEVYQANAATDSKAKFSEVWAA